MIGLTGLARSGKDTAAAVLLDLHGYKKEMFAAPLKEFVAGLLCCTQAELESNKDAIDPILGVSPRRMLQTLGTDWGRNTIRDDIWVQALLRKVNMNIMRGHATVVTDLRFENEAAAIREAGGIVIHVVRPDALRTSVEYHASEAGIAFVKSRDYRLFNDGTLGQFQESTERLFSLLTP